jgi:hypothetical protein
VHSQLHISYTFPFLIRKVKGQRPVSICGPIVLSSYDNNGVMKVMSLFPFSIPYNWLTHHGHPIPLSHFISDASRHHYHTWSMEAINVLGCIPTRPSVILNHIPGVPWNPPPEPKFCSCLYTTKVSHVLPSME